MAIKKKAKPRKPAKRPVRTKTLPPKAKSPTPPDEIKKKIEEYYKDRLLRWGDNRHWAELQEAIPPGLLVYRKRNIVSGAKDIASLWPAVFKEKKWGKIVRVKVHRLIGQYPAPPKMVLPHPRDHGLIETAFAVVKIKHSSVPGESAMLAIFAHQQDCMWFPVLESWSF